MGIDDGHGREITGGNPKGRTEISGGFHSGASFFFRCILHKHKGHIASAAWGRDFGGGGKERLASGSRGKREPFPGLALMMQKGRAFPEPIAPL